MKFQVYYRTSEEFRNAHKVSANNIDRAHYFKVGNVNAFDLSELFRRMNVVDGSDFELVGRGKRFHVRSMSVGDIAIDENGNGYLCNNVGWAQFDGSIFNTR
jgi:hypothetical protein